MITDELQQDEQAHGSMVLEEDLQTPRLVNVER